jgi:hypothetical protein
MQATQGLVGANRPLTIRTGTMIVLVVVVAVACRDCDQREKDTSHGNAAGEILIASGL